MPTSKSAKKRVKTSEECRKRNQSIKTKIATLSKKVNESAGGEDRAGAKAVFQEYCSVLDKAVKRRVVKANTAARRKSRATMRLRRASSGTA